MAGEADQLAGTFTNNDGLEERGHQKRTDAQERENEEQESEGLTDDHQKERNKQGAMPVPDFEESDNLPVDEVTPESSK
jgi:hypothetical protein